MVHFEKCEVVVATSFGDGRPDMRWAYHHLADRVRKAVFAILEGARFVSLEKPAHPPCSPAQREAIISEMLQPPVSDHAPPRPDRPAAHRAATIEDVMKRPMCSALMLDVGRKVGVMTSDVNCLLEWLKGQRCRPQLRGGEQKDPWTVQLQTGTGAAAVKGETVILALCRAVLLVDVGDSVAPEAGAD